MNYFFGSYSLAETPVGIVERIIDARSSTDNVLFLCPASIRYCETNPRGLPAICKICKSKWSGVAKLHGIQIVVLPEPDVRNTSFWNTFETQSPDILERLSNGVIANYLKTSDLRQFNSYCLRVRDNILNDSRRLVESASNFFYSTNADERDHVFIFNGRFPFSTAVAIAARSRGLQWHFFDAQLQQTPIVSNSEYIHSPHFTKELVGKVLSSTTECQRNEMGKRFINSRRNFERHNTKEKSFFSGMVKGSNYHHLSGDVISIFPSSTFEYEFNPYGYDCVDQVAWIRDICEFLLSVDSSVTIVIRMHPNMATAPVSELQSFKNLAQISSRVHYLGPRSFANSYELIRRSSLVVGFASFTIVEAALLDILSFQIGPSRYSELNIAIHIRDIDSFREAYSMLDSLKGSVAQSRSAAECFVATLLRPCDGLRAIEYSRRGRIEVGGSQLVPSRFLDRLTLSRSAFWFLIRTGRWRTAIDFNTVVRFVRSLMLAVPRFK